MTADQVERLCSDVDAALLDLETVLSDPETLPAGLVAAAVIDPTRIRDTLQGHVERVGEAARQVRIIPMPKGR